MKTKFRSTTCGNVFFCHDTCHKYKDVPIWARNDQQWTTFCESREQPIRSNGQPRSFWKTFIHQTKYIRQQITKTKLIWN